MQAAAAAAPKRVVRCNRCGEAGHNRRTCRSFDTTYAMARVRGGVRACVCVWCYSLSRMEWALTNERCAKLAPVMTSAYAEQQQWRGAEAP